MDPINLSKGGRIDLAKQDPGLKRVRLELKWNPNKTNTGTQFDCDSSVFVCKYDAAGEPKLIDNKHFVFYGNKFTPDNTVTHSGDDTSGGTGEVVIVDLTSPADEISFVVTIHEADTRRQNFGQISRSSITLFNDETGEKLGGYNLEDDFTSETAVQFGSLYKKDNGAWAFKAVGAGYNMGLRDFVIGYGGTVG